MFLTKTRLPWKRDWRRNKAAARRSQSRVIKEIGLYLQKRRAKDICIYMYTCMKTPKRERHKRETEDWDWRLRLRLKTEAEDWLKRIKRERHKRETKETETEDWDWRLRLKTNWRDSRERGTRERRERERLERETSLLTSLLAQERD